MEPLPRQIYLAGPLFTGAEQAFNAKLAHLLELVGYTVFLPQRDCRDFAEIGPMGIAQDCIEGLVASDLILAIVDGSDADSGTCVELGFASALNYAVMHLGAQGKLRPIWAFRTDLRGSGDDGGLNLMVSYVASVHTIEVTKEVAIRDGREPYPTPDDVCRFFQAEMLGPKRSLA